MHEKRDITDNLKLLNNNLQKKAFSNKEQRIFINNIVNYAQDLEKKFEDLLDTIAYLIAFPREKFFEKFQ